MIYILFIREGIPRLSTKCSRYGSAVEVRSDRRIIGENTSFLNRIKTRVLILGFIEASIVEIPQIRVSLKLSNKCLLDIFVEVTSGREMRSRHVRDNVCLR